MARAALVVCIVGCLAVCTFAQCNPETSQSVQGEGAGCEPMLPRTRKLQARAQQHGPAVAESSSAAALAASSQPVAIARHSSSDAAVGVAKRNGKKDGMLNDEFKGLNGEFADIGHATADFFIEIGKEASNFGKEVKDGFQTGFSKVGSLFTGGGKQQPRGFKKGRHAE